MPTEFKKTAPIIGLFVGIGIILLFTVTSILFLTNKDKKVHAATACSYSFTPYLASPGQIVTISIVSARANDTIVGGIAQAPNSTNSRVGPGNITVYAPTPVTGQPYFVYARDTSANYLCASVSGNSVINISPLSLACRADFNHDGMVNTFDQVMISSRYNTNKSSPNWDPMYDLNGDGKVNLQDLILFASVYGQKCSQPLNYTLNQPNINGSNVTFSFSPVAGGNLAISINGANLQKPVVLSIPSGATSVNWINNFGGGNYSAYLVDPSALSPVALSNTVNFTVSTISNLQISCALGSNQVQPGGQLGIAYQGVPPGYQIFLWDLASNRYNLGVTVDSTSAQQWASFTVPANAVGGSNYYGFIGTPNPVTCKPTSGGALTIVVPPPPTPVVSCTINPSTIGVGGSVTLTLNTVAATSVYSVILELPTGFVTLGIFAGTGSAASYTIPSSVSSGTYTVALASSSGSGQIMLPTCTPQLTIQ